MSIEPQNLIFSIINFLLLLLLLRIFLYKPVLRMLDQRRQTIEDSLNTAEKTRKQASEADAVIQQQLDQAKLEVDEILNTARAEGEELKRQILNEAHQEASHIAESTSLALKQEREEAWLELREQVARLAVGVAGRMLAEEMTTEQQDALLAKYTAKVERLLTQGRINVNAETGHAVDDLLRRWRDVVTVQVSTALPLTEEQESSLCATLSEQYGKEIVLEKDVDPELIGGAVLRIGDTLFDGSIRRQLESLQWDLLK